MAFKSSLRMTFRNQDGRTATISLDNPKDELTDEDVKEVMDDIIDRAVFITTGGDLVSKVRATVVETTDTILFEE